MPAVLCEQVEACPAAVHLVTFGVILLLLYRYFRRVYII